MSDDPVVRRFEAHSGHPDTPRAVYERVTTVLKKLPRKQVKLVEATPGHRVPMATFRLQGASSAMAKVRNAVSAAGARVHRDWLEVPPRGPGQEIYPDRRALRRIDPEWEGHVVDGGPKVRVAIVDSGMMIGHPDLKGFLWTGTVEGRPVHGASCMDERENPDVTDQDGHGTMLAGTILATARMVDGLQLMPVKFFDVVRQPASRNAAHAMRFAVKSEAHIINLSFDLGIGSRELEEAFESAGDARALVVVAAGNTGSDNDRYPEVPARYAEKCRGRIITVMATDLYDQRAWFSNFGDWTVDLAAPGVAIASTRPFLPTREGARRYGRYSGTSAAAAHVTGAAALIKSRYPALSAEQIKMSLVGSVDTLPRLRCASGGRLNLGAALRYAAEEAAKG
jgi:hypothetical protein